MASQSNQERNWADRTHQQLRQLCQQPANVDGQRSVIPDRNFQTIAECLRDLGYDEYGDRPRHYTVLAMMERIDLLKEFQVAGLLDNSFPYPDRKSLPPLMKRDPDACHQFLELQCHVMSAACQMEKGLNSPHVYAGSGDVFFLNMERLGKGGYASVDKVQSRVTKQIYARKKISRSRDLKKDKEVIQKFENELQILKKLDHIHLVKVFASYTDLKYVALIMKPVAEMDLKQYLQTCGNSLIGAKRTLFRTYYGCLANALAYLHDSNIRHKDIKPNNILINRDDIYITDFGTAIEFDGDKSMTTGTVKVVTRQYQSPEVSRGTKRGTASDIWSLGVTFLEITTVFRGESLDAMNAFLRQNGAREEYVFANLSGAVQWIEFLRKNSKYPRTDNPPMAWIRDMLQEKAADRPDAHSLCQSIRQTSDGTWCCPSCRNESSSASDISSDEDNEEDHTQKQPTWQMKASTNAELLHDESTQLNSNPKLDPSATILYPRTSSLRTQVVSRVSGYFSYISLPRLNTPTPMKEVAREAVPEQLSDPTIELSENTDPYACNVPGSFPDFANTDESVSLTPVAQYDEAHSTEQAELLLSSLGPCELEASCGIPQHKALDQDANLLSPFDYSGGYGSKVLEEEEQPPSPRSVFTYLHSNEVSIPASTVPPPSLTSSGKSARPAQKARRSLRDFFSNSSGRKLMRSRSDENLEIQRQTWSLLASTTSNIEDFGPISTRRRKYSDGGYSDGEQQDGEGRSKEATIEQLQKFKTGLDRSLKPKKPARRKSIAAESVSAAAPIVAPPAPTVESFTEQYVQSTIQAMEDNILLDPNVALEFDAQRPDTPGPEPTQPRIPIPTTNSFISWLANARAPQAQSRTAPHLTGQNLGVPKQPQIPIPTTNRFTSWHANARAPQAQSRTAQRLTGQNLGIHNDEVLPLRRAPFKLERASVYMRQVHADAASSVPTSIMSTGTRETFKLAGLSLSLQDRTNNFLGRYSKMGQADAVRMLLQQGCNPGTKSKPRPGPLFSVIRGASSRHTKCLRALIEHKVDVNVKARSTEKTPLMEAIEQESWPGYLEVIVLLLRAGANPNTKDSSGDNPLLKLLQGGLHPLEEYHRKALALLLSPTYKTNVGVTPLGTQNKPLHLAIRRKDPWAVGMILQKAGCDVEAENSEGLTPILLAATSWNGSMSTDQLEILDLLLEKKADVNLKMLSNGKTPLHIAVSYGLLHALERLMEHGADPKLKTDDGYTALDLAKDRKKHHGCTRCYDCSEIKRLLSN